jgi:hypothetical protein
LAANATLGWWWADPMAALVIAAVAVGEGREAWRGNACCPHVAALRAEPADQVPDDGCSDACCTDGRSR